MNRIMGRQFTLVEMLVVVAIIAILAALLIPSLQKALDAAHGMACMNQQRQINLGFCAYINDNNGVLFAHRGTPGEHLWSYYYIGNADAGLSGQPAYIEDRMMLRCFSALDYRMAYNEWTTYAMFVAGASWPFRRVVLGTLDTASRRYYLLNRVKSPSKTILLGCSATLRNNLYRRSYASFDATTFYLGAGASYPGGALWLRHNGMVNGLFFDGHSSPLDVLGLYNTEAQVRVSYNADYTQNIFP